MDAKTLLSVLTRLNNNYGKGNITAVEPIDMTRGTFTRVPFQGQPQTIVYRIIPNEKNRTDTVLSMRHSVTVPR